MPLSPVTVDVPLSVVEQSSPKTSGPLGRLTRLVDSQVTKFQSPRTMGVPSAVRVEKRDAFATLSDIVRDSSTGAVVTGATLYNQSLLTEFDGRLLLVSEDTTHVYSDATAAWEKHAYQLPTHSLTEDYVHTSNSLAITPDVAQAEGVYCYTWVVSSSYNAGGGVPKELPGCYFRIEDSDGVVLRADTRVNTSDTRIKVVSDGAYFWILSEQGNNLGDVTVRLVDRHGLDLTSTTIAVTGTGTVFWDLASTSFGILLAQPTTSAGVKFTKMTYNSLTNTIVKTTNVDTTILGFQKLAFLTNDVDGYAYLATAESIVPNDNTIHAYRVTSGLVQDNHYSVATSVHDEVANITGYVDPDGSPGDLVVAWSVIDPTVAPDTNYLKNFITMKYAPFSGSPTDISTALSMNLASRAFKLGASYYAVGFYPSNLALVSATSVLPSQPTYFLVPLRNPNQRVAGRWEYAAAYCDWQASNSKYNFALASVVNTFPNSGLRTALSYRAESFTSSTLQVNGDISLRVQTQATTVGVKAYTFGDPGLSVSYANEILLPGPGASSWSGGEFSESGIALAFEQPLLTPTTTGTPSLALRNGTYQYVVVGEWTDNNGNRVRSRPSPAASITITGGNKYVSLSGYMNHVTNKRDVLISIYRTDMVPDAGGGYVTTTLHYKVTVDAPAGSASPLYNDNTYPTWEFSDHGIGITANEVLYTDKGQLENFPAPPFSRGCVWQSRVLVAAPDNSIWFSSAPTEGDALWWHPAFRLVLPTNDPIRALANMENYLLVLCENSLWYFPATTLPDSSGTNGSIPTAVPLPFKQGCTGHTVVTRDGCYYASNSTGLWLITRALENIWIGEPAEDALDGPILAMAIDDQQRIYSLIGSTVVVYDTIANAFYEWSTPSSIQYMTTYQGALTYSDGQLAWQQLAGTYVDSHYQNGVQTYLPYYSSLTMNFLHLGGVENYKRIWEVLFAGQSYTACTLVVGVAYNDDATIVESKSFNTTASVPLVAKLQPAQQLCSSIGFTLTESLTGSQQSGKGFALEVISLGLGIEPKGLRRVGTNKRI